jgi:hypothetical protein
MTFMRAFLSRNRRIDQRMLGWFRHWLDKRAAGMSGRAALWVTEKQQSAPEAAAWLTRQPQLRDARPPP